MIRRSPRCLREVPPLLCVRHLAVAPPGSPHELVADPRGCLVRGQGDVHAVHRRGDIQVVASAIVWVLLDVVGVFSQITQIVSSTGLDAGGFDLKNVLSLTTVVSGVTIFSIVEVVIFTLLATIAALIYNVVSSLVGGVHVTLGDD